MESRKSPLLSVIIAGQRVITCVFAGPRKWIHEVFQSRLLE